MGREKGRERDWLGRRHGSRNGGWRDLGIVVWLDEGAGGRQVRRAVAMQGMGCCGTLRNRVTRLCDVTRNLTRLADLGARYSRDLSLRSYPWVVCLGWRVFTLCVFVCVAVIDFELQIISSLSP